MKIIKMFLFLLAGTVLVFSGCAKKSPIPAADASRLEAERAIVMAQAEIDEAAALGADVSEASAVLSQARAHFSARRYGRAYSDAARARDMAARKKAEIIAGSRSREDAAAAIERAENLIRQARSLGGDVSEPAAILAGAREAFGGDDYFSAVELADRAADMAGVILAGLRAEKYTVGTWEADRDCLWNIAARRRIYNDPWKWKRIYRANQEKITDPDLIYPGQILIIPRD